MSACLIARLAHDSSIHLHLARVCDLISQVIMHTMQGVEQEGVMTPRHDLLSSSSSERSPYFLSAQQHGGGGNVTARSSRGTKPPRDYSKLQLGPYRVEAGSNEPFTLELTVSHTLTITSAQFVTLQCNSCVVAVLCFMWRQ